MADVTRARAVTELDRETFVQRRLEDAYRKTYARLNGYRNALEYIREVLVWRRPYASAVLYLAIHWVFM